MSFVQGFEKTASAGSKVKSIGEAVKYIADSGYHAAKGIGKGVSEHAKSSYKKMQTEPEKIKKAWKGWKSPKSYEALGRAATTFAPEAAVGAGGVYLGRKYLSPEGYQDTPMAYY